MFRINVDLGDFNALGDISNVIQAAADEVNEELAQMAKAKAIEIANTKLNSRRDKFIEGLDVRKEDGAFCLVLAEDATWIDDGQQPHSMLDDLLASPKAKIAADGSRYLIVPFEHSGKGKTNTTPGQMQIVAAVKSEFKKRKIPWSKVERDDEGRPKVGRLHRFDIEHRPLKDLEGVWQGKGAVGEVRQGHKGTPFLQGVSVYQTPKEGGGVNRSVATFRVASSKQQGSGMWEHPGVDPANIFDEVYDWLTKEVENHFNDLIIDRVLEKL